MLYEGKAKKVYTTEDPDVLIVSYKDDATAFNGLKKGTIVGKGAINNRMTNFIFKKLEEKGVPTHLVEELNDRETAVKKVEIVPLEVIIRNYSAGNKQKIGIISAMLHYPQLLILDEPFNFLDPSSQSIIKHLLKKYNEEHQATVIISSHNLNHTVDVCPRIALLEYGIIIRDIINEDNSAEKELEAYFNVEE